MKLSLPIVLLFLCVSMASYAQRYRLVAGNVTFFSDAPMEDIEAENTEISSLFDVGTGVAVYKVKISGFQFEKSLMQEHFNEKYLESDKYPESTFRGRIRGYDPQLSEWQQARAEGDLKIHGVTREIAVDGQVKFSGDRMQLKATFPVKLEDYKIKIPKVVFYNIAEVVKVTLDFSYEKE